MCLNSFLDMDDYLQMFESHLGKLKELLLQRATLSEEIEKYNEMVKACFNMLSDYDRQRVSAAFTEAAQTVSIKDKGLTEAIKEILRKRPPEWLAPIQVRDRLQEGGFDFSGYTSNPLSSVHSVLKRFKPNEVESKDGPHGRMYRWRHRIVRHYRRKRTPRVLRPTRKSVQTEGGDTE